MKASRVRLNLRSADGGTRKPCSFQGLEGHQGPSGLFFGTMQGSLYSEKVMSKCTLSSCRSANPTQLSFLQGDENVHFIGGFASSRGLVVASPPRQRGPQVRAPWRHGGHGAVDVVGPVVPPGLARGRGDAGVYTDWRKWPLGAVLGHLCTLLRCCRQMWRRRSVHRSAKMTSRSRFGSIVYTVAMQGSREWRRRQVGVFAEVATHTNPRGARYRN